MVRSMFTIILLMMALQMKGQQHHSDGVDDCLQYVPYAAAVTLKGCGVGSNSDWPQFMATAVGSWVVSAGVAYTLKHNVREWRPDHSDRRSFPSGHSTFAFAGATVLLHEYGQVSPWIPIGGYAVATLTAADRVRRDCHHWYDVASGAAIGILSTELTYYVSRSLLGKNRQSRSQQLTMGLTPQGVNLAYQW